MKLCGSHYATAGKLYGNSKNQILFKENFYKVRYGMDEYCFNDKVCY